MNTATPLAAAFFPFMVFAISCIHQSSVPDTEEVLPVPVIAEYEAAWQAERVEAVYHPRLREGEREVKALMKAYAPAITGIGYSDSDWTIDLYGKKFYWSDGKLLSEENLGKEENFRSYGFYSYPDKLPVLTEPGPEMLDRISGYSEARKKLPRDNTFLETLYGAKTLDEILGHIKKQDFLGFELEVHEKLKPVLKAVELDIQNEMKKSPELAVFLETLETISCFNWRRIEGSVSRSYHSFGIAVDFIPRDTGGKQIYWNWTRVYDDKWYSLPYEKRWMVPEKIVKIFEKYGFVWGGKWLYFDNMHFEYRPELLIMAGKEVKLPPGMKNVF